jgi:hypothetical protein
MAAQEITGLTIEKGTDFAVSFVIDAADGSSINLVNYTAVAKIRRHPTAVSYKQFSTSIDGARGYVTLIMSKEDTKDLISGRNYFDVLLTYNNETTKPVTGTIIVEDTSSL